MWFLTVALTDYNEDFLIVVYEKMKYNDLLTNYDDVHNLNDYQSDLPDNWSDFILESIHEILKSYRVESDFELPMYNYIDYPSINNVINDYLVKLNKLYEILQ